MNKVIVFDKGNCRVVSQDDSIQVFYTDNKDPDDNCPDEIVEVVVKMYNEGKTLAEIDEYLLNAECTQDARETVMEGLFPLYHPCKTRYFEIKMNMSDSIFMELEDIHEDWDWKELISLACDKGKFDEDDIPSIASVVEITKEEYNK